MKVRSTAYEIVLQIVGGFLIAAAALYMLVHWSGLPQEIPIHYNAAGEIDRYGGKQALLSLLAVMCVIYGGMVALGFFPKLWNTGVRVTEENRERVYRTIKHMLSTASFTLAAAFSFLMFTSMLSRSLPGWFPLTALAVIAGSVIVWLIRLFTIK